MAQTSTASSTELLAGLVDRVTFHNSKNGFCVLRVKARGQRDLITLVGHAAMISAGEFVQASGSWINDRTHGLQFKASFLKATAPTTVEGIEKYLGSGMIRGIGPVYAKKLVRAFGEAVFEVIQQEPSRLSRSSTASIKFFWRVNDHDKAATAQLLDHCRSREPGETVLGTVSNRQKTATAQLFEHRACRNLSQSHGARERQARR
jgi:ATP-dependent exoDNAse (exonuclease V) alpha subunit